MFGCDWFCCNSVKDTEFHHLQTHLPKPFSLPSPLPQWPPGTGFATGKINLGELEVTMVTNFEIICNFTQKSTDFTFYKPIVPNGFFSFGHYGQQTNEKLTGYVLAARTPEIKLTETIYPCLKPPVNYLLIWSTKLDDLGYIYVWQPKAPVGYRAMGFVVTTDPHEPGLDEVRCVRSDLTEKSELDELLLDTVSTSSFYPFRVWNTKPCYTGMFGKGVPVGTFFCSTYLNDNDDDELNVSCLKNVDFSLEAMPNLDQVNAVIDHYGPTVFFHPDEIYLPSSVSWFFENGALLFEKGKLEGIPIDILGSNLPKGGKNDGEFWLDLPEDNDNQTFVKSGNLESAELYVHVKPALGGVFTDIAMWVFCPFNGPATLTVELLKINIEMNRIGEHVGDWEHYTLRVNNFTGELTSVYFSEHSGGKWVDVFDLEFIEGNKPIVYSSKCGHASFPSAGTYIQGYTKLGIGVKNDVARSDIFIDSSKKYMIIAAEYLGNVVKEPDWLQYMREWGPRILYDGRSEFEKVISHFPLLLRLSLENLIDLFPMEIYGEAGPTGPKEKDNWFGDERC